MKCAQIFVHGHCLFLRAHSFPCAMLSRKPFLDTDDAQGETPKHAPVPNRSYCVILDTFFAVLKIEEIFSHMTCFDQLHASKINIWTMTKLNVMDTNLILFIMDSADNN